MEASFTTTILVDKPASEVYSAINDVRGWWQGEIVGESENIDDEFSYRMKEIHYSRQKVTELIPNKKVAWLVTDSNLSSFRDKNEWNGTKIIFDISEKGGKTLLHFTHEDLVPASECYADCSWGWSQLIEESLFSLITTGKGKNVFG